ncbi:host attachment protein [Sulfitobacter sp. M57]|uniref:host attachment family protein n=1 Tax=unclassified Sulfitobacter TaxID=196795 RepID=UPI0023E1AB22|nr:MULTISPECIES: host attachment family protein [unclassified Sulfitobacter]MDF3413324.1 host attachment protein [Sulfitobacter sp. KE5]MDF3421396.1 host attachment protein [Sulfitobacter sp. KE43]MDF3431871.1 host attachment protein [Sulfitobacter sp. KE42]MDF3457511.1 host attachment protein [Sulfitobacter sp. S74]MDF3461413.1 host attachment protein [Sulfitobacter sp. Ks18]
MTKLKNGTWVLIADGEKALFLENRTDGEDPFLEVFREEQQENPPNRAQAANRPGRFNDGPSVHRSAVDDTDWHQLAKDRFAAELADILYKKVHAGAFDDIVLVAPPGTLGELRTQLHQEVKGKVIGEIDKTLTNHALEDIEKIVVKELQAA